MSATKTALTVAALAATGYSRVLGQKVSAAGAPASSGTQPAQKTSDDAASAQLQLNKLQWVIPALTGALVVVSSFAGEQQRPASVLQGIAAKQR